MTENDKKHCEQTVIELNQENCTEPEIIMTSIGYVDVWPDGAVTYFGKQIYQCDVDILEKTY